MGGHTGLPGPHMDLSRDRNIYITFVIIFDLPPFTMSDPLANMKRTAQGLLDGFSAWDLDAVMTPRAEDCVHILYPQSLGLPVRNNREFRRDFGATMPLFKNFKVRVFPSDPVGVIERLWLAPQTDRFCHLDKNR